MTVGERIKELRIKLNMSQVDFADKIKVAGETLSNKWEDASSL